MWVNSANAAVDAHLPVCSLPKMVDQRVRLVQRDLVALWTRGCVRGQPRTSSMQSSSICKHFVTHDDPRHALELLPRGHGTIGATERRDIKIPELQVRFYFVMRERMGDCKRAVRQPDGQ